MFKSGKVSGALQGIEIHSIADIANALNVSDNYHYVATISLGDKVIKKTRSTKNPFWTEGDCYIALNGEQGVPDLQIRITCKTKKGLGKKVIPIGYAMIWFDGYSNSKHGATFEITPDLMNDSGSPVSTMRVKLQMSGATPIAYKITPKLAHQKDTRAPPIFKIIKFCSANHTVTNLEEFLKTASPDDVNVRLPKSGNSPLHEACIERQESLLNALLKFPDINVNLTNEDANSPLHYFCEKWTSPDYLTSFNLFFNRKDRPEVNAINSNGETPIFKAIFNPSIRALLMEALIKQGAKLDVSTRTGETLLHYAVHLNRADLVRIILQNRPVLEGNKGGATPEGLAKELNGSQNIKQYLQQVSEIFKWLEDHELGEDSLKAAFVKNEITLELLPDISDTFLQQMGIQILGVRMKIIKACEKLKGVFSNQPKLPAGAEGELSEDVLLKLQETFSETCIDGTAFEYTKHLGTGAAGDVYRALYQDSVVAVKVLSAKSQEREVEEFKREFEILRAVRNPFVVKFIGVAMKPRLCMVMEYCARGSLHHVMKDAGTDMYWTRAIHFCRETVLGLKALHDNTPQILHRDLKSPNILVSHEWHIKIADFGLSRFVTSDNMPTMKQMRGTYQYLDPEVYNGGTFSAASDIYSMSILFWEVAYRTLNGTYQQPFSEFKNLTIDFQIIIQSAKEDLRPTIPMSCPESFKTLIIQSWAKNQADRPSLEEILKLIDIVEKDYNEHSQEWDSLRKN
jgi:hypothetical protein